MPGSSGSFRHGRSGRGTLRADTESSHYRAKAAGRKDRGFFVSGPATYAVPRVRGFFRFTASRVATERATSANRAVHGTRRIY